MLTTYLPSMTQATAAIQLITRNVLQWDINLLVIKYFRFISCPANNPYHIRTLH